MIGPLQARCEPPLRSSPRLICLWGIIFGRAFKVDVLYKLGKAKIIPSKQIKSMLIDLNFEKYSIYIPIRESFLDV